jgi:nitrogen fixation protein NifB
VLFRSYANEIVALGIKHVTVTVNTLDPVIGAKIYKFVSYQGKRYEGVQAAELLLVNQLAGIEYLVKNGILVKINIVMIKGINDSHIPAVVKKVKELGVFVTNIMPLIPASGSAFEHLPQTSMKELNALRDVCQLDIQQMRHCQQCRADAIGLLGEDRSQEFRMCNRITESVVPKTETSKVYQIAVTSKHGKLVDQHFGHATQLLIYQGDGKEFELRETRTVNQYCAGMTECDTEEECGRDKILEALQDCNAILTMRIGYHAKEQLGKKGIYISEYCDTVETGLRYTATQIEELSRRQAP